MSLQCNISPCHQSALSPLTQTLIWLRSCLSGVSTLCSSPLPILSSSEVPGSSPHLRKGNYLHKNLKVEYLYKLCGIPHGRFITSSSIYLCIYLFIHSIIDFISMDSCKFMLYLVRIQNTCTMQTFLLNPCLFGTIPPSSQLRLHRGSSFLKLKSLSSALGFIGTFRLTAHSLLAL